MAINIKFTKFDNTPWGFRLAGGSDFPQPLTVIRVSFLFFLSNIFINTNEDVKNHKIIIQIILAIFTFRTRNTKCDKK